MEQKYNDDRIPAFPEKSEPAVAEPATEAIHTANDVNSNIVYGAAEPSVPNSGSFTGDSAASQSAVPSGTELPNQNFYSNPAPELDPIYQEASMPYPQAAWSENAYSQPSQPYPQTPPTGNSPYFSAQPSPSVEKPSPSYQELKERRKGKGKALRFIAACLALALALYGSFSLGSYQAEQRIDSKLAELQQTLKNSAVAVSQPISSAQSSSSESQIMTVPPVTSSAPSAISPVVAIAERVVPSVVTITSSISAQASSLFSGSQSSGSGVLYKIEGGNLYIITNHHVIENASSIRVSFYNEETASAEVVGYDSRNDLAVLKVNLSTLNDQNLTLATFGDSSVLKVGQLAVAIGNPLGEGHDHTITAGVISSVNRTLDIENIKNLEVIQTDAAINPGNSGGALVNEYGEVIGINTAKYLDVKVEGMGFAIPSNIAIAVIDKILKNGSGDAAYVLSDDRPFLGIGFSSITSDIYAKTGVPFGVYVTKVYDGSAAHAAGVQVGDILFSLNGVRIKDANMLFDNIGKLELGQTIKLGLVRGEEILEVESVITSFGEVNAQNGGELNNNSQE